MGVPLISTSPLPTLTTVPGAPCRFLMRLQELRLAIQATGKRLKSSHVGKAIKRMGALGHAPPLLPVRAAAGYDTTRQPSVNTMLSTAFHALTWQRVRSSLRKSAT